MIKINCVRWAVDLSNCVPTLENLVVAVSSIQPEEKKRLMKFIFQNDFLSSLVGRLLMRKYFSETTSITYNQVLFDRDVKGKPLLLNSDQEHPISFNVSHQGYFVILAGVSCSEPIPSCEHMDFGVGCDVMKIEYSGGKSLSNFFDLMSRKFSADEWKYINRTQHSDMHKLKAFMRHWCLKESYVKELGVGITTDLQKISFSVNSKEELNSIPITSTTLRVNENPMKNWSFEEHILEKEYCAAIAFKNCKPQVGCFKIMKFEDILYRMPTEPYPPDIYEYCKKVLEKPKK